MHHHACDWYFIEHDPGVPSTALHDPLAGLDVPTAKALTLTEHAKAIGTAQLSAQVLTRDSDLRQQYGTVTGATQARRILRLAANNTARAMGPVSEGLHRDLRSFMERWLAGSMTYDDMRVKSGARIRTAYEAARRIGRDAVGLDRLGADPRVLREEESWFRDAVRAELSYWHKFLAQVQEGAVAPGRIAARVDAYVSALNFMYEAARVQALPDNTLIYWMGPKDDRTCESCDLMLEWSPFTKETIPAVPRDGTTQCGVNCRHRVVVRVARSFNDVVRRKDQLDAMRIESRLRRGPPRERMLSKLREVREESHGRHGRGLTVRGPAGNPFGREKLPAVQPYRTVRQRMQMEGLATLAPPDAPASTEHRESVGVFLRFPPSVTAQFPEKDRDKSPAHVTLLNIGDCTAEQYQKVVRLVRDIVPALYGQPIVVELTDYGEFTTPKGLTIAHMIPRVLTGPTFEYAHDALYRAVIGHGIQVDHIRSNAFKPHVTLAYLQPGERYEGPRPSAVCRIDAIEVWGNGVWGEGKFGCTVIPMNGSPPVLVWEGAILPEPGELVERGPYSSFDAAPYASLSIREVAQLLQQAVRARDTKTILPLIDRVLAGIETASLAVEGRPRATQVAQLLRSAFNELVDVMTQLPEAVTQGVIRFDGALSKLEETLSSEAP